MGKRYRDLAVLSAAAAPGEGHTFATKEKRYLLGEFGGQAVKDYFSCKPCEMLWFAFGIDAATHKRPAPRPAAKYRAVPYGLQLIPSESPAALFARLEPEILRGLRDNTAFAELLHPLQGHALALNWHNSPVMFREVFLATSFGKTLVMLLPLLCAPGNRALIIFSLSRSQVEFSSPYPRWREQRGIFETLLYRSDRTCKSTFFGPPPFRVFAIECRGFLTPGSLMHQLFCCSARSQAMNCKTCPIPLPKSTVCYLT